MFLHHKHDTAPSAGRRRGMTLIELMVVIAVVVIALGMMATMMRPMMEETKIREASRLVNVFIGGAQARAVQLNRPVGVLLERLVKPPDPRTNACVQLYIAETPPVYGGDTLLADARGVTATQAGLYGSDLAAKLVEPGDLIKFDFKGDKYRIHAVSPGAAGSPTTVQFSRLRGDESVSTDLKPAPQATEESYTDATTGSSTIAGVPYQIFRRPRRSSADPLQLPATTVLDLTHSGVGDSGVFTSTGSVIISFAADGSVEHVYEEVSDDYKPMRPGATIHLLIGRFSQLGAANLADQRGRWVSVAPQSGVVTTVENLGGTLAAARALAIQRQQTASQ